MGLPPAIKILPVIAEVHLTAQKPTITGCKVDQEKYKELINVIEQVDETSASIRNTHPHGLGRLEETAELHDRLNNDSDVDRGDSYVDEIGRLYRTVAKY